MNQGRALANCAILAPQINLRSKLYLSPILIDTFDSVISSDDTFDSVISSDEYNTPVVLYETK